MVSNTNTEASGWVGWILFAGIMLVLVGIFQFIIGLTALFNSHWFVATNQSLVVFNFTTWGWIQMLIGAALVAIGMSLFRGSLAGRVMAVIIAGLSAIANLAFITAYPIWSLVVIAVDVLIIYALIVHGGELAEA